MASPYWNFPLHIAPKDEDPMKGGMFVIHGDREILAPICEIESEKNELQMSGFEFMNMANYGLKDKKYATDLLSYCRHEVIEMMKKMGYMLGMGLGKEGKGVVEFPNFKTQLTREALGFLEGCDGIKRNLDGKMYPGWEIFFDEKFTFKEKPMVVIEEVQVDWMDYMDAEAMEAMLKVEGDVLAIS
ncbi:hypothetical protein SO802_012538 [Lithocarpus litseifolius]|uniref:G-patch domain-containing protein n=1 Tax=Lithocarpus litseifolius TaxID=425828 RepID=A0AAW2D3M8_9ROSI